MEKKEKFLKQIGENIKRVREQKEKTLEEISKRTGIRKQYLIRIEKGIAYGFSTKHFLLISEALKVSPDIFLTNV